jgi:diacylglycerol kinase
MKQTIQSFYYAASGWRLFFTNERNAKIELAMALLALAMSWLLHISCIHFVIVLLCIALVIAAEMFNTSIEHICNIINPTYDISIKQIKDISAGAVFWCSAIAAIIGLAIFAPPLYLLFIKA